MSRPTHQLIEQERRPYDALRASGVVRRDLNPAGAVNQHLTERLGVELGVIGHARQPSAAEIGAPEMSRQRSGGYGVSPHENNKAPQEHQSECQTMRRICD